MKKAKNIIYILAHTNERDKESNNRKKWMFFLKNMRIHSVDLKAAYKRYTDTSPQSDRRCRP